VQVAALYDVHGNLPALDAVLADPRLATADLIVCGGDLVAGRTSSALVVAGHIHMQADRRVGDRRFVVAGSVGRPYEGVRGAFWALLDDDVELLRTDYDVEAAAAAIRATEFPGADEHAENLLDPPRPEKVSAYFESLRGA